MHFQPQTLSLIQSSLNGWRGHQNKWNVAIDQIIEPNDWEIEQNNWELPSLSWP